MERIIDEKKAITVKKPEGDLPEESFLVLSAFSVPGRELTAVEVKGKFEALDALMALIG